MQNDSQANKQQEQIHREHYWTSECKREREIKMHMNHADIEQRSL